MAAGSRAIPPARIWLLGARPRTLGVAVSPVAVGTAAAAAYGQLIAWRALAALVVSLALQVGVNYANDYSDGVRGTDSPARVGPVRLVGGGLAPPAQVRVAAAISFGVAALAGLALALAVNPWLLLLGLACMLAAVGYTGGRRPYGYAGLGEVAVLVFFGLVGTAGSCYVQLVRIPLEAVIGSLVVGLGGVAVLLANNLRDVESDALAGKRTLAVRLGRTGAARLYVAVLAAMYAGVAGAAVLRPWALLGLGTVPLAGAAARRIRRAADAPGMLAALVDTARVDLLTCLLLALGLWIG